MGDNAPTSMDIDAVLPLVSPERKFWIEVPRPPQSRLASLSASVRPPRSPSIVVVSDDGSSTDEDEASDLDTLELQEIVGEHTWPNGKTYLYARLRDEVIRKFTAGFLEQHFPEVVEDYKDQKANDQLEDFDPTSTEVLLKDRPPVVATSKKPLARSKRRSSLSTKSPDTDFVRDEESDDHDEDEDAQSESDSEDDSPPVRLTRSARNPPILSPRKPRRRMATRGAPNTDDSDYSAGEADSGDDDMSVEEVQQPTARRKARKYPRVQPEYGVITSFSAFSTEADGPDGPLFTHMPTCSKCHTLPAHLQKVRKRKRMANEDEFEMGEEEALATKGGWVACTHCCQAIHFGCLAKSVRDEMIRAIRKREENEQHHGSSGSDSSTPVRRTKLLPWETTTYFCAACTVPSPCLGCTVSVPNSQNRQVVEQPSSDVFGGVPVVETASEKPPDGATGSAEQPNAAPTAPTPLLFRCMTCQRPGHYEHLPPLQADEDASLSPLKLASEYQNFKWQCKDCHSWKWNVDMILAWRPYPADAKEPDLAPGEIPPIKDALPREYLVKWEDRSFRRVEWVPHLFLVARFRSRLSNYLRSKGPSTKVQLLDYSSHEVQERLAERAKISGIHSSPSRAARLTAAKNDDMDNDTIDTPYPDPDAELRIPSVWKTVDRILDVRFWHRTSQAPKRKTQKRNLRQITSSDEDEEEGDEDANRQVADGIKPDDEHLETWDQRRKRGQIEVKDVNDVAWAYMKWQDLPHESATWDTPPTDVDGQKSFEEAFHNFILAKNVVVPILSESLASKRDNRKKTQIAVQEQPKWQPEHLKLKPFQLEGLTWLYDCWYHHQHCILADEMGLGKTVQIATFIGKLVKENHIYPMLIVVPNSTITNWIREMELWAPGVRVVMYAGTAKSREIIRKFEMVNSAGRLTFHVLLATYESITSPKDFGPIFKSVPRWEVTIVDEGQRLKSDNSLIFKRMKELKSVHRILMTGTPINNNIREIFNLLNYLDPEKWDDLAALENKYDPDNLTDALIKELHELLRPYFLRRVKSDVMKDLPRKHEVIVPVNMTTLQSEVWKSILNSRTEILAILAQNAAKAKAGVSTVKLSGGKTNLNNALMQIRKCMQHPYLVDPSLEPPTKSRSEAHKQLVDASTKLRFLQMMLPKLKKRGHRVLLFSQFAIALNIIEDFLVGEDMKFLRLDGNTPQRQRQKDMDAFNRPNSEYFIYILSTRAGGVGINLWSADVVILHDVDFNPHNDLQAIARAHRMGQTKPVLVFTLMVKDSAEEKIVEAGKKKLVLDHVIVQKMDEEATSDTQLQSILSFGAKALFEDNSKINTTYTSDEIDSLIDRVQQEAEKPAEIHSQGGMTFGFTNIWERQAGNADVALAEYTADSATIEEDADFWAQILEQSKHEEEQRAQQDKSGRGVRRKATKAVYVEDAIDNTWKKVRNPKINPEDSEYEGEGEGDGEGNSSDADPGIPIDGDPMDLDIASLDPGGSGKSKKKRRSKYDMNPSDADVPILPIDYSVIDDSVCGICAGRHEPGKCELIRNPNIMAQAWKAINDPSNREPLVYRIAALSALQDLGYRPPQKRPKTVKSKPFIEDDTPMTTSSSLPPDQPMATLPFEPKPPRVKKPTKPTGPTRTVLLDADVSPSGNQATPLDSARGMADGPAPSTSQVAPKGVPSVLAPSPQELKKVQAASQNSTSGSTHPFPANPKSAPSMTPTANPSNPVRRDVASSSSPASSAPSRTCRLCNTKLHPLTQCPKVKTPDVKHIRQTLADVRANMSSGSGFIQDKLFTDELARILRQIEEREAARSQAIMIDDSD